MRLFLHEITDQETEFDFTQAEPWVLESVQKVDEQMEGKPVKKSDRPVHVHLSLRKVDEVVVVSGDIQTNVELICSRCAIPFRLPMSPTFTALFCKDPIMAGVGYVETGKYESGKPGGQNRGVARQSGLAEQPDKLMQDLDITYLSNEWIDFGDVLTEQLQLEIPFQPLCKEDCKGMCTTCGTDLNLGRCACAKLTKANPFSVLKSFKN